MADKQPIVVVNFPDAVLNKLTDLITQAEAAAQQYLIALTAEQRKKRLKMGPKSVAFVTKAFDYATATPAYAPAFVDVQGLGTNLAVAAALDPLAARFNNLGYSLESTNMVANGSAMSAGLLIYNGVQQAADNNQRGAQPAFNDLKTQFERTKHDDKPAKS